MWWYINMFKIASFVSWHIVINYEKFDNVANKRIFAHADNFTMWATTFQYVATFYSFRVKELLRWVQMVYRIPSRKDSNKFDLILYSWLACDVIIF